MPFVSVLYINDEIVGPHLELLRNVCDPMSRSRPHVTVRFFDKLDSIRREYSSKQVDHINLIGPGAFGLDGESHSGSCVVFIRCESEDLEHLEHKPDFPQSEFHITLYEGKSVKFARDLVSLLTNYRWRFRVLLPSKTTLSEISIRSHRPRKPMGDRVYREDIQRLFQSFSSDFMSESYMAKMSNKRRLKLVELICNSLERKTRNFPIVKSVYGDKSNYVSHDFSDNFTSLGPDPVVPSCLFVTPPELAEGMARLAVSLLGNKETVDFGDPAIGIGALYQGLRQVIPPKQIKSAIGIDIDPQMATAAYRRWAARGLEVKVGDYLHMERLPLRNLILANPPYLRHQLIPGDLKEKLRERASVVTGKRINARAGQYVYFLLLCHQWMKLEAAAVWLIPSEFMQTVYGSAIRGYLTEKVELVRVHKFDHDDPQFETAHVLPVVIAFRNRVPSAKHVVEFTIGGTLDRPNKRTTVVVSELRKDSTWNIPRKNNNNNNNGSAVFCIGDLFNVKRGIATGSNNFFILRRKYAKELGIPDFALRPILPKARNLSSDIVNREPDGYPSIDPQLSLLDCNLSKKQIIAQYPELMAYLNSAKVLGILDRNLIRRRHPWYKQEHRDPAPFLCTYMGRGGKDHPPIRIIFNKSDAVTTNTYLMMYPREKLKFALNKCPDLMAELFIILKDAAQNSILSNARMHAGGLHKIEPGELIRSQLLLIPSWLKSLVEDKLFYK